MRFFWEKMDWEKEDPHLVRLTAMPFQRSFPKIPSLPGFYFIRGPRQIGKSSYLKTILSFYSKQDAKQIGFIYCDELKTFQDLKVAIEPFIGRSILILDEISFVEEWWRTVKSLLDQNKFEIIIITGSNTWDIQHGADLMPGRWGEGGEIEILPMDFLEFKKAYHDAQLESVDEVELLKKYLWTGGFPITLQETQGKMIAPKRTIETIQRWLLGDAVKLGKSERYLRDLMLQIAKTTQTPLSFQKLSQRSQIASHHTAGNYIELLESTFCAGVLYAYDFHRKIFQYKKDKKFYFRDPIYFHAAVDWGGQRLPDNYYEAIAESVAYEYLRRRYSKLGFIHTQKGEVDFIVPDQFAIEVKWTSKEGNLSQAYKNLSIDKKVWQPETFFRL